MARIDIDIAKARRLYTEEGIELPEIAKRMQRSEQTVYRWKQDDAEKGVDWDKQRSEMQTTSLTAHKEMLKTAIQGIINLNTEIKKTGAVPGKDAYNLRLLINSALALQKEVDSLGYMILWGEKFTAFMQEEDPELLDKIFPHLEKFGKVMIEEERKKR